MAFLLSSAAQPTEGGFRWDLITKLRTLSSPAAWVGLTAVTWASSFSRSLGEEFAAAKYSELGCRLSREELRTFCAREDVPVEYRVAAVMAWGRSNPRNPQNNRNLWASIPNIVPLLKRLPEISRKEAFAEFRRLVARGDLQGMRASFFTKLMFFFGNPGAYILDQWMAKAMLALRAANWVIGTDGKAKFARAADNYVRLGYGGTSIDAGMTEEEYETYCQALESLVKPLGRIDGADVERWLFSTPKSEWRTFLKGLNWKMKASRG